MLKIIGLISLAILHLSYADSVLELTDKDFSTIIKEHDTVLVMFYAPWCGHCKKLKPEFERASTLLDNSDPPIKLAKVDCTDEGKATCSQFSVSGYPTLKIFVDGTVKKEYQGPRDAAGLVKYMKSQVGPSAKEIKTVEEYEKFIGKDEVVVIGFFENETNLKGEFLKACDKHRDKVQFGITTSKEVISKQGVKDGAVLFRPKFLENKFEKSTSLLQNADDDSSDITADRIITWISKNYHGIVGHRTRDNSKDFDNPLVVAYYNVDYVKNPKGTNYWRNRILKVAVKLTEFRQFNFAISNKDDFQHELNEFGFDYVPNDKPIVLVQGYKKKKFVMKDEFTLENFEAFLTDLGNDKLEPYIKSEPIPEDNSAPVKVAVAKNFDEVVTNNGMDTLVEFYAPWCGHCKQLAPVFDELGEKMQDEDVAIVKFDASNNDVPSDFDVRGFPTIYWLDKDAKTKPIKYEGGRTLDDFLKYIAKNTKTELKNYDRKGVPKSEGTKTEL